LALTGKRIGITGGAGFIGSHLVERLLDANEIVVYDNLHRNALQFAHVGDHPHFRFVQGDVTDLAATTAALAGCQIVIHCAAIAGVYSVVKSSIRTMEVNFLGTHAVVRAALGAGVERFVDFSTSEVYGAFVHNAKESEPTALGSVGEARWVYAASKLASEHLSYAHYLEAGLPVTIVRPFNVYGPRQVGDGAVRGIVLQALKGEPVVLYNDGTQIRAWCFIDDFVDGVLACTESPDAVGQVFNLGNPQGTITNLELTRMILRLANSRSEITFRPHPGSEIELRVPSIHKAAALVGYAPKVGLEQGLAQTIAWYANNLAGAGG
jgi:nucleoside-diphosphate-sugar epimerase